MVPSLPKQVVSGFINRPLIMIASLSAHIPEYELNHKSLPRHQLGCINGICKETVYNTGGLDIYPKHFAIVY